MYLEDGSLDSDGYPKRNSIAFKRREAEEYAQFRQEWDEDITNNEYSEKQRQYNTREKLKLKSP